MTVRAGIYYPDLSSAATISLTAGSTAAGYALTDLQDANLSTTWKSGTTASGFTIKLDLGASYTVSCVAILGHNLYSARNVASTHTRVVISHSTDDAAYTTVMDGATFSDDRVTSDLPILCGFTAVTARYIKIVASDPNTSMARAYEIADIFVAGQFLDLVEPTKWPWTQASWKTTSRTMGSDAGMGVPCVNEAVTQSVKIEIGSQAFAVGSVLDDTVPLASYPQTHAAPSFQHFIRSCWSLGLRFLFCPFTTGVDSGRSVLSWSAGFHTVSCVAGDFLSGTTSGASCVYVSNHVPGTGNPIAAGSMNVSDWDGTAWVVGETVENVTRGPANHTLSSFTDNSGNKSRQRIGVAICRASHGTAKCRTPFAHQTRRSISLDFDATSEWFMR